MTVRVLVVAAPLLGHVLPLVPLATALRAAGNEVLVAAGGVADRVGGLPARDLAPGFRLDRAALRVLATHRGAGTVLTALAFGAPQLVIPGPGDRRYNAELVAGRGARLAGASSRATITRLLADGGLRAAAAEVRAEIAPMPEPAEVADVVLAGVR